VAEVTRGIVAGQKTFDDYTAMADTIRGKGIDRATKTYQAALDRYNDTKKKLGL
jgi:hypothetical protein